MKSNKEIRNYYDNFAMTKLLGDFWNVNLRHREIKKLCKKFIKKDAKVLEIGCGAGIITRYISKFASKIDAYDISPQNISIAEKFVKKANVKFTAADPFEIKKENQDNQLYDVILLADVIEHLPKVRYGEIFNFIQSNIKIKVY